MQDVEQDQEQIIDVTHSIDGVPIDLSSPEKNHGVHYEKLVEEAIEQEVRQQEAIHHEENMKEALIEQVFQEEHERQYYQQLMAEEALREVERQQLKCQQEEVEFAEEAQKRKIAQDALQYIESPFDKNVQIIASNLNQLSSGIEMDDSEDVLSISDDSMITDSSIGAITAHTNNTTACEIEEEDSDILEPPPFDKIAPTRPIVIDEQEIPEQLNEDSNNHKEEEEVFKTDPNGSQIKSMESNSVPPVHRILSRIVSNDDDLSVEIMPPAVRQTLLSQFVVDDSTLELPHRSPPPPFPPATITTNEKILATNNNDVNNKDDNNGEQYVVDKMRSSDNVLSPELSLCSSLAYEENNYDINDVQGVDNEEIEEIKPGSLRFNDDMLTNNVDDAKEEEDDDDVVIPKQNEEDEATSTDKVKNDEGVEGEEEEETSDGELPCMSNWPKVTHNVAASMAIGGSNQSPSTPPKRSKIPRLRKSLLTSYGKTSSCQSNQQPPGVLVDSKGRFISAASIVPSNVIESDNRQENDDNDDGGIFQDGFLSAFLVASGVSPVLSIRVTAFLRKSEHVNINPNILMNKTNRMEISLLFKQAGLKSLHIKNIFQNADKLHQYEEEEENDKPENHTPPQNKINLNKLKKKMNNNNNNKNNEANENNEILNRTIQAKTPPVQMSKIPRKKRTFKKPSVDPTEWARKRKEKAEKAKEARDSRLFGM